MRGRLLLTGHVSLADGDVVVGEAQLAGPQGRLVVAALALEGPLPEMELARIVWNRELPRAWEPALRVLVGKVRTAVNLAGADIVRTDRAYGLSVPDGTWVDIPAAVEALADAERLAGSDPDEAFAAALIASSVATRPFLPGVSGTWPEARRRELIDVRERALAALTTTWPATSSPAAALQRAIEVCGIAPFRDRGWRTLVRATGSGRGEAIADMVDRELAPAP